MSKYTNVVTETRAPINGTDKGTIDTLWYDSLAGKSYHLVDTISSIWIYVGQIISSDQGKPTDLFDLIAETSYTKSFRYILCNVNGEYEVKGGTGSSYVKSIFNDGQVYPAEGITKIRKYGGSDLLANEIIGYE